MSGCIALAPYVFLVNSGHVYGEDSPPSMSTSVLLGFLFFSLHSQMVAGVILPTMDETLAAPFVLLTPQ
jgi:hypothetical protein